ncbi:hypothetical protein E2C01_081855 [Portunus trituberculatus]|uniref:Uncharacterized protein n=1 Tax=Portunus trituberculatus TaxID=210409 RepID=A0A5B7IZZ8_PORTR|nr:hypothetical protein [Portunus trituberculatus]
MDVGEQLILSFNTAQMFQPINKWFGLLATPGSLFCLVLIHSLPITFCIPRAPVILHQETETKGIWFTLRKPSWTGTHHRHRHSSTGSRHPPAVTNTIPLLSLRGGPAERQRSDSSLITGSYYLFIEMAVFMLLG